MVLWVAILVADVLAATQLSGIAFRHGLDRVLAGDPRFERFSVLSRRIVTADREVAILLDAADFADPAALATIRDFAIEARFIDGVADVVSVFSLHVRSDDGRGGTVLQPLLARDLPPRDRLVRLFAENSERVSGGSSLMSADRTASLVLVTLDRDPSGSADVLANIGALARHTFAPAGIGHVLTGLPVLQRETVQGLLDDFVWLTVLGTALSGMVCVLALRSLQLGALVLLPTGTALLWAFGVMAWAGLRIDVLSIAVPVLIVVQTYSDVLHLTFETGRQARAGAGAAAPWIALRRAGPACVLASLTTAFAFFGLLLSDSDLVRDLGLSGGIGILVALVAVLATHPVLFASLHLRRDLGEVFRGNRGSPHRAFAWTSLPALGVRRPRQIAALAVALLIGATWLGATGSPRFSLLENTPRGSAALKAFDRIERDLLAPTRILVTVPVGAGGTGIDTGDFAAIARVHAAITAALPLSTVVSLAGLADSAAPDGNRTAALLDRLPQSSRNRLVTPDGRLALIGVHVAGTGSAGIREAVARIAAATGGVPGGGDDTVAITGLAVVAALATERMIRDLTLCFVVAALASGGLIALWQRSFTLGLIALVPNALPIALIGAGLAVTGIGVQFWSAIGLTIAFGLAVDDTVHVLNRVRLNLADGTIPGADVIYRSVAEVLPVLTLTTLVLTLGLAATLAASVPPVAYFGLLCIAVFVLALGADCLVLPALLEIRRRFARVDAESGSAHADRGRPGAGSGGRDGS